MKAQKLKQTHLTLKQREIIQTGIENRSTKVAIAKMLGKDPTTIAKEIKKHRELRPRNTYNTSNICNYFKVCKRCTGKCRKFEMKTCNKRDRSPGACNNCPDNRYCRLDKYFYNSVKAHKQYLYDLSDSREGINLTHSERKFIGDIIKPLIQNGQSIYQILTNHPEITQCEKSIYNYIDAGVFREDYGIINLSLKEKVKRKQFKKYKKRKEPANYEGRKYSDYLIFKKENPQVPTTEMDTLYNNPSGPYIQTLIFEKAPVMIGFLHQNKTSESMANVIDLIEEKLDQELYHKLFSLLLTDRGTEFQKWEYFEANTQTGEVRSNIFYCDPMASYQKPNVENNHNFVRDIIPNKYDLSEITQKDIELIFSHINSTPRESLEDKTPFEMFEFIYGKETLEILLKELNMQVIEKDKVVLKPHLWTKK